MSDKIHTDGTSLKESPPDLVSLSGAVHEKFVEVSDLHLREKGFQLTVPESMEPAFKRWREMVFRHREAIKSSQKQGNFPRFLHTKDEIKALQDVAQWVLDQNQILRNQPIKKMEWSW